MNTNQGPFRCLLVKIYPLLVVPIVVAPFHAEAIQMTEDRLECHLYGMTIRDIVTCGSEISGFVAWDQKTNVAGNVFSLTLRHSTTNMIVARMLEKEVCFYPKLFLLNYIDL